MLKPEELEDIAIRATMMKNSGGGFASVGETVLGLIDDIKERNALLGRCEEHLRLLCSGPHSTALEQHINKALGPRAAPAEPMRPVEAKPPAPDSVVSLLLRIQTLEAALEFYAGISNATGRLARDTLREHPRPELVQRLNNALVDFTALQLAISRSTSDRVPLLAFRQSADAFFRALGKPEREERNARIVDMAKAIVKEFRPRMDALTPEERDKLFAQAKELIKAR